MKRKSLVATAASLLVLGSAGTASAGIDPFDWINTIILQRIHQVLSALIWAEEQAIDRSNIDIYNRYRFFVMPDGVLDPIKAATSQVFGIRREVESLACGWQFSPRTTLLRRLYLEPVKLCRPGFQAVFGEHAGLDRDLHELADHTAVLTANQVSTRVQSEDLTFTRAFKDSFSQATVGWFSPGEANRYEAVMLAMSSEVALANNQLAAQKLMVDELDRELERREDRHRAGLAAFALSSLQSLGGPGGRRP
jgi:hypothetical protein